VLDSGQIILDVDIPRVTGSFHKRNFYTSRHGQDFTAANRFLTDEADALRQRIQEMAAKVRDPKLEAALGKLDAADNPADPETAKRAEQSILEARTLVAQSRQEHLTAIRQAELDGLVASYRQDLQPLATPAEVTAFDALARTAQRAIDNKKDDYDGHIVELRSKIFGVLWKQDWFVIGRFKVLAEKAWRFSDPVRHAELVKRGTMALQGDDFATLRDVVIELETSKIDGLGSDDPLASISIVRG
jgi:molecular chaperone DnaK